MSTIRLWNKNLEFLVGQAGPAPKPGAEYIALTGTGVVQEAVKAHMREEEGNLYITIDLTEAEFANLHYVRSRRGGLVTKIEVEDRFCECRQNRIITTTIAWSSPAALVPWL